MVEKVWVGKKVQVLSLEELEKHHYKDEDGVFWYTEVLINKPKTSITEGNILPKRMQKYSGKILEVYKVFDEGFLLKGGGYWIWSLWMVKEPISIEKVLEAE